MVAIDSSIVSGAPASSSSVPAWLAGVISSKKIQTECSYSQGSTALCQNLRHPTASVRLVTARTITYCNRDNVDDSVVCTLLGSHGERVGVLDDDAEVRAAAADALGELARGSSDVSVRSALLVMLGDDDWAVRRAALRALGEAVEVGDSAVEARLCELLTAASWKIRAVAAEGFEMLGARGRGHATHSLLEVLEDDEDWAVRKAAAAALAKVAAMGDMVALDALLASGAYDSDWRVRKQALLATGAIAQRGCEVAVQGLLLGLEDVYVERCGSVLDICSRQDCDVRATAVRMLELVAAPGDPRVLAALQRCLGECEDRGGGGKFEEALRCAIKDSAARVSLLP